MRASTASGKPRPNSALTCSNLIALDLTGDVLINDTIVKVQDAIGADTSMLVTLVSESQMFRAGVQCLHVRLQKYAEDESV